MKYFLVLDIGTTGIKALLFDEKLEPLPRAYFPLDKYVSENSRIVEQNPEEILEKSIKALQKVVAQIKINSSMIVGLGITTQRETTILWDKTTGKTIHPAIVWEDTRTKAYCDDLQKQYEKVILDKTGLQIDAYFSASKIHWILENIPESQDLLSKGNLLFGTVDTWILWNLLEGNPHVTDYTNASRTLLFNIHSFAWDNELLNIFAIPEKILPECKPTQSHFGILKKEILGFSLPALAVCGDQQSSMYAAGTTLYTTKITYGTGTFMMQTIGESFQTANHFFTTITPGKGKTLYALEAKVAKGGKQVEPYLDTPEELYPILDNIAEEAAFFVKKFPHQPSEVIVDGGLTRSDYLIKKQEELLGIPVRRQNIFDGTALGVAKLLKDSE